jgi:CRP/FNR family cyclic AMP-dependent transcriptional regulator
MPGAGLDQPLLRVALLEADPELGRWLTPGQVTTARRTLLVPAVQLPPGGWAPPHRSDFRHLGFLVLKGLLARDEHVAASTALELVGPGDLVRPWDHQPDEPLLPRTVVWRVFEPTTMAVLGRELDAVLTQYPRLALALLDRAMQQTSRLATHQAICQLTGVDARLLVLFWHLAERWGRVTRDGLLLPLPLRHATLGHLVGAKRPTVTLGLQRLADRGLVEARRDGAWLLKGAPPGELHELPARRDEQDGSLARRGPGVGKQRPEVLGEPASMRSEVRRLR